MHGSREKSVNVQSREGVDFAPSFFLFFRLDRCCEFTELTLTHHAPFDVK